METLLERKETKINLQNGEGDTALMIAVGREYENIVNRLLKDKDIDVNQQNHKGDTALLLAERGVNENRSGFFIGPSRALWNWIRNQLHAAEKNKKCKTECKKTPGRGQQGDGYCTCDTDPYSYFFRTYDWDYCVCPREHDDPFP